MELLGFLIGVVAISASGVMMPGPVTATAIAMGGRNRFAGALIAVGHGIVEFPLMILVVLGAASILNSNIARVIIGLIGGMVLLMMANQMFAAIRKRARAEGDVVRGTPVVAGILLSAGNPYFLVWWATIGLGLATRAGSLGAWAFALFALVHWACDFLWLTALSWASHRGAKLLTPRRQNIVLGICALVVLAFGLLFLGGAILLLVKALRGA